MDVKQMLKDGFVKKQVAILIERDRNGKEHYVGQTAKSDKPLSKKQNGYQYNRKPEGNTVKELQKLLDKYIIPMETPEGTYYTYRCL